MLTMEAQRVRMCVRAGHAKLRDDSRLRVGIVRAACLCGSFEHQRARHALCRLNPRAVGLTPADIVARTAALELARVSRTAASRCASVVRTVCLCGSSEHQQVRHAQCPLNPRAAGLTVAQVAERTTALGLARSLRKVNGMCGSRGRVRGRVAEAVRVVPGVAAGDARLTINDELRRRDATRKRKLRVYITDEERSGNAHRMQIMRLTTTNLDRALLASQQRRLRGRWGDAQRGRHAARMRRVRLVESDAQRDQRDECTRDAMDPSVPPTGPRKADLWNVVRTRKRRRVRRNARRRDAYQYFRVHLRLQKLQGVHRDAGSTFGRLLPCVSPCLSCAPRVSRPLRECHPYMSIAFRVVSPLPAW